MFKVSPQGNTSIYYHVVNRFNYPVSDKSGNSFLRFRSRNEAQIHADKLNGEK